MVGMPYPPTIAQTGWTKILRVLCNPWENISARGFCEFGEFCGRMQWLLGWCTSRLVEGVSKLPI